MGLNIGNIIKGGLSGFAAGGPPGALVGAVGGALSGEGGSSSSGGSAAAGPAPIDYYAKYGAQAASANAPLTLAGQRYGQTVSSVSGAQGLLGSSLSSGQLTALRDAAERGQLSSQAQVKEVADLIGKGLDLQSALGNARLSVGLLDPQFLSQAATAARGG